MAKDIDNCLKRCSDQYMCERCSTLQESGNSKLKQRIVSRPSYYQNLKKKIQFFKTYWRDKKSLCKSEYK